MKELEKATYKLIQDHATIKEAFIIDELQAYMDLKDPSNPKWVQPVRVRLQEKKDWERLRNEEIRESIDKHLSDLLMLPVNRKGISDFYKELFGEEK